MKAIKIDFKKELIELRNGCQYYDVAEIDAPVYGKWMVEGKEPELITCRKLTYHLRQVYNAEKKENVAYLVRQEDDRLFDDLNTVSKGFIDEQLEKTADTYYFKGKEEGKYFGNQAAKLMFSRLKWWQRLFFKA